MKTRFFLLLPLASLLLTGCFSGEQGQSSLVPRNSVVVTTSPAVAIAPCQPVRIDAFTAANSFTSGGKTYNLLGIATEDITSEEEKDLFAYLQQKGFCIKEDPAFAGRDLVYLFTSENGLINGDIIRRGLGTVSQTGDYIYKEYLLNLQEEAQANGLGIWKDADRVAQAQAQDNTPQEDTSSYQLIFPQDAGQYDGETVTLRMTVGSIGRSESAIYINSEADYTSEANVPALIQLPTTAATASLEALADTLQGKSVDITGQIDVTNGRAQILLKSAQDLQVQ